RSDLEILIFLRRKIFTRLRACGSFQRNTLQIAIGLATLTREAASPAGLSQAAYLDQKACPCSSSCSGGSAIGLSATGTPSGPQALSTASRWMAGLPLYEILV